MNDKFSFTKLDASTRAIMVEEIQKAKTEDQLYFSTRFNESGRAVWPDRLLEAAGGHDEHWLAYQLEADGALKDFEGRARPTGGYTVAHVPHTASGTLADGQFNRFYIAAICRLAIAAGHETVDIYRARHRDEPRAESGLLEGTSRNATRLLEEVRGKNTSLRCDLLKPNSGLSIQLRN
jgi:hypothetical protein